jgi:hypothetical protein
MSWVRITIAITGVKRNGAGKLGFPALSLRGGFQTSVPAASVAEVAIREATILETVLPIQCAPILILLRDNNRENTLVVEDQLLDFLSSFVEHPLSLSVD